MTTDAFYWDMDEQTRAFAKRFRDRVGKPPSSMQAGIYSAVTHYLNAVKALGNKDPDAVSAWMRKNPVNDFYGRGAMIRSDGIVMHDMYLFQVKSQDESKARWDYLKQLRVIAAKDAYPPPSPDCVLASN
jgi:branched-chain amino acid transport system substrate-binding protein